MRHIRLQFTGILLIVMSACTPAPADVPAAILPTAVPSPAPASATFVPTATSGPPTAAPTLVPPTMTVVTRRPIPPNFPLATFEMTDADGRWTLTFAADGTYEATLKNSVPERGTIDVVEDRLTLHAVSGSKPCKPAQGDGTYRWAFDGTLFKLILIEDRCTLRGGTLSGSSWSVEK